MTTIFISIVLFFLVGPLVGNYIIKKLVLETLGTLNVQRLTDIGERRELIMGIILTIIYTLVFAFFVAVYLSMAYDKAWLFTLLIIPLAIRTSIQNIIDQV